MSLAFTIRNAIAGLTVHLVCPDQTAGAGTLTAATADTITWQAPGDDDPGAAVEIANGEQKIVASDTATLWIVVERTAADDLEGEATLIITTGTTTAERLAQVDEAITRCLKAQSTGAGDGSRVEIAELDALRAYRKELARELAVENGTAYNSARCDCRGNF